ncbi:MarR family winged helix-turn-helix transcriptional regulator [Kitasatospora sp. NPDC056783]|uniref:MarR family winged helix-turn-helix transcriptional regulator n=1 Tax=Kitasatospora sp. NPDC056783 TaxID=3345943 RepID=UPI0036A3A16E
MTTVSSDRESDIELWWQVSRLSTYMSQLLERRLMRSHGIGLTDFIALSTIQQSEPRVMQMQELAEEMGVNQSTLSRVAVRLERSGLVKRTNSEHDRRFVVIRLTEVGRRELGLYSATFTQELHTAFEMAALTPSLSKFLTRIRPGQ